MKIGVMKKGDRVLNVTTEFVVIERKNCEVDIIPIIKTEEGFRIDKEHLVTIGYGNNTVEHVIEDVVLINF